MEKELPTGNHVSSPESTISIRKLVDESWCRWMLILVFISAG